MSYDLRLFMTGLMGCVPDKPWLQAPGVPNPNLARIDVLVPDDGLASNNPQHHVPHIVFPAAVLKSHSNIPAGSLFMQHGTYFWDVSGLSLNLKVNDQPTTFQNHDPDRRHAYSSGLGRSDYGWLMRLKDSVGVSGKVRPESMDPAQNADVRARLTLEGGILSASYPSLDDFGRVTWKIVEDCSDAGAHRMYAEGVMVDWHGVSGDLEIQGVPLGGGTTQKIILNETPHLLVDFRNLMKKNPNSFVKVDDIFELFRREEGGHESFMDYSKISDDPIDKQPCRVNGANPPGTSLGGPFCPPVLFEDS